MLRLKYLRYSFRGAIPATNFVLWSTKRKEDAPYAFIEHLLRQENYWAAVNALEVCLRKANKRHYTHNFARLWKSIEPFATRTCANDPEEVLWATTDLLQTFCEGLLRRTATQIKPWESATKLLSNMRKMIEEKCDAKYTWSNSRSFRRQELIKLDKAVITKNQFRDLEIDEDTVKNLLRVRGHAEEHQDVRLLGGIRWRIGVLIQGIDPTKIPTPPGSIPYEIYEKRHKLILQANKTSKGGWFPRLGALWESLCDEHARGQDLFSDFSGENPNIAFSPGPPKPVKRVLLLGHTGAGKSTLFRTITGAYAPTSDAPIPCTVGIQKDRYHWQHCILECIDTPGFGDSRGNMSNDRVLSGIAEFLKKEYLAGRRIHTVLYLIDVSKNRIDESASRQAKVFEALMGHDVWSNVCFIFTHGVSKHDQGPGAELNAQKQLKFKKELQTVTLRSARKGGAVFSDLGLDFDNHASEAHEKPGQNHTETITKETQSVANADDTNEDFLDFSSDGQEDSDDNRSNAGADGDTSSLPDVSQDEYHPADTARGNVKLVPYTETNADVSQ
jgi:GTP-binding protein EngB required for normal cell division